MSQQSHFLLATVLFFFIYYYYIACKAFWINVSIFECMCVYECAMGMN